MFTKDELLTNITIYWATQTATSAARFYYDNRHGSAPQITQRGRGADCLRRLSKGDQIHPRRWLESRYNMTRFTIMPRGGHFAAMEQPELLVDDVRAFFRDLRSTPR